MLTSVLPLRENFTPLMSNLNEDRDLISRRALCGVTYLSQSQSVQTSHWYNLQARGAASTACKSNFMAGSTAWVGGKSERDKWILKMLQHSFCLRKPFPLPTLLDTSALNHVVMTDHMVCSRCSFLMLYLSCNRAGGDHNYAPDPLFHTFRAGCEYFVTSCEYVFLISSRKAF